MADKNKATIATSRWVTCLVLGLVGSAAVVFFTSILPFCRSFPYSDEWDYLEPLTSGSGRNFMEWLFAEHVDHRIPLQNALHAAVLKLTGFDFRSLIGVNFLVACVLVILLMNTAKNYRCHASFGDLFMPLCVLSLGAGFSAWGFEFQFLSSTFLIVLFLCLTIASEKKEQPVLFDFALASLFACSWCGLNGMVVSSLLTLIMAAYLAWERLTIPASARATAYAILTASAVTNALLWILWRPSNASNVQINNLSVAGIARFFYGLFNSSLIVYAFRGTAWKFSILAMLLASGLWFGCRSILRKSRQPLSDVAMFGVLCATVLLMLSVAVGRSKYESWSPGLEMHYGVLTVLMPIVSWIIVSSSVNCRMSAMIGVLLVALFARAYVANWDWRFAYISDSKAENRAVQRQIALGGDTRAIAQEYMKDFFFVDNAYTRSLVASGIKILRREGGRIYR